MTSHATSHVIRDYDLAVARDPIGYLGLAIPAEEFAAAWDTGNAIFTAYRADFGLALIALGAADDVRAQWSHVLASAQAELGGDIQRATVPADAVEAVAFRSCHGWNWMTTRTAPPLQPGEENVVLVDDAAVINAFLDEANPDASTRPGDPELLEWAGIADPHDAGRLLAIAAVTKWRSGARVLVSVATRPDARGQGLAGAVSAFLTRRVLASGYPQMSLGYYAENLTAERVYERLGFEVRSRNMSGWLVDRPDSHH